MKSCGKMRAGSVHVVIRHASVEVQVHCGVLVVHVVLLVVRVVPVLLVMLQFISLYLHSSFTVAIVFT